MISRSLIRPSNVESLAICLANRSRSHWHGELQMTRPPLLVTLIVSPAAVRISARTASAASRSGSLPASSRARPSWPKMRSVIDTSSPPRASAATRRVNSSPPSGTAERTICSASSALRAARISGSSLAREPNALSAALASASKKTASSASQKSDGSSAEIASALSKSVPARAVCWVYSSAWLTSVHPEIAAAGINVAPSVKGASST